MGPVMECGWCTLCHSFGGKKKTKLIFFLPAFISCKWPVDKGWDFVFTSFSRCWVFRLVWNCRSFSCCRSLLVYMYVSCVWRTLFLWSLSSALALAIFPPLLLLRFLRFEEKGVVRGTFRVKFNKDSQSLTEHGLLVGLCFNSHLLQTESF